MSVLDYFKNVGPSLPQEELVVFTDGACINNGKKNARAGLGVYFPNKELPSLSLSLDGKQTNNRAELMAIKMALKKCNNKVRLIVYTDSKYSINCITKWGPNWEQKKWKNWKGHDVSNKELIKEILDIYRKYNVELRHVRSHQPEPIDPVKYKIWYGNRMADKLANQGILSAP